jgi:hypothetical protein
MENLFETRLFFLLSVYKNEPTIITRVFFGKNTIYHLILPFIGNLEITSWEVGVDWKF